jgi:hypothetical protein
MIFAIKSGYVGSTKCAIAFMAYKVKPSKIIGFAERVLAFPVFLIDREELRSNYLSTILQSEE